MPGTRDEEVELLRQLVAQNEAAAVARKRRTQAVAWVVALVVVLAVVVGLVMADQRRKAAEAAEHDHQVCVLTEMMLGASKSLAVESCRDRGR